MFSQNKNQHVDMNENATLVYSDFSKAFDSVPHHRLLFKLESCGIESCVSTWTKDFLVGRRQSVCVDGTYSDWSAVTSSARQGSVLRPVILFRRFYQRLA